MIYGWRFTCVNRIPSPVSPHYYYICGVDGMVIHIAH
nr:MAG TPA: hypothetical protein [Caudoviricetes sp.]